LSGGRPHQPVLPGDVISNLAAARKSGLPAEQSVLSNVAGMTNLHKVIDLRALTKPRRAYGRAINTGICLNFHSVFNNDRTSLDDLVVGTVRLASKSKAVASNDGSI